MNENSLDLNSSYGYDHNMTNYSIETVNSPYNITSTKNYLKIV